MGVAAGVALLYTPVAAGVALLYTPVAAGVVLLYTPVIPTHPALLELLSLLPAAARAGALSVPVGTPC